MKKRLPTMLFGYTSKSSLTLIRCLILAGLFIASHPGISQRELLMDTNTDAESDFIPYQQLKPAASYIFFQRHSELWSYKPGNAPVLLRKFTRIGELSVSGNMAFFSASDGEHGVELWKSNGTPEGTLMVKDIVPGPGSSNPESVFAVGSSRVFFTADDGVHGRELWKSSGAASSTKIVKDIVRVVGSSNPANLCFTNNTLFFTANDGQHGYELWKTDGTSGGTTIVKDINPAAHAGSSPKDVTVVGDHVYFVLSDGLYNSRLWKSDGSEAGTLEVKRIEPGGIDHLNGINNTLFFAANDGVHGHELWKSDGTSEGTFMLADLGPDPDGSHTTSWADIGDMFDFTNVNGILFFFAVRKDEQFIVRSDGTVEGTYRVAPVSGSAMNIPSPQFTYANDKVYFFNAGYVSDGFEDYTYGVWTMNTDGGDMKVLRAYGEQPTYYENHEAYMTAFKGEVYLTGILFEGWKVLRQFPSGANAIIHQTTTPTAGINTISHAQTEKYTYFGSEMTGSNYGFHIFRTDGTTSGTDLIADFSDYKFLAVGSNLYYSSNGHVYAVNDNSNDEILLTRLSMMNEWFYQNVTNWFKVYNTAYFATNGNEVWKANGTPATTKFLKKFDRIVHIQESSRRLYVLNQASHGGLELWRTHNDLFIRIKTFSTTTGNHPSRYASTYIKNDIYFTANDNVHGVEVWKSDGTTEGTYLIADVTSDSVGYGYEMGISRIFSIGDHVYVSAWDTKNESHLYKIDGNQMISIAGLAEVKDNFSNGSEHYIITSAENGPFENTLWHFEDENEILSQVGDPGSGYISHAVIDGKLYISDNFYNEVKYVTHCQVQLLNIEPGYPLTNLDGNLFYTSHWDEYGREPSLYYNIGSLATTGCPEPSARAEKDVSFDVTSHPNPYTHDFSLNIAGAPGEKADAVIYNSTGHPVERMMALDSNTNYEHIGSHWPRGIYLIKVLKGDKVSTRYIVKK